jgi:hypothetical protein
MTFSGRAEAHVPDLILKENEMSKDCGCGRSPNGKCIGWHGLTNEQYEAKKSDYEKQQLNESAPQLLKE